MLKASKSELEYFEWFDALVFCAMIITLAFLFVVRPVTVQGISMVPTLHENDRLLVYSLFYEPSGGDVVVLDGHISYGDPLVKRVIGVAGDEIDIDALTGEVYVNGEALNEPYLVDVTTHEGDVPLPLIVPEGYVFVMGDNRSYSIDSRYTAIGMIEEGAVLGKVFIRIYPFQDFDLIA